jgi:hypothetical protein
VSQFPQEEVCEIFHKVPLAMVPAITGGKKPIYF